MNRISIQNILQVSEAGCPDNRTRRNAEMKQTILREENDGWLVNAEDSSLRDRGFETLFLTLYLF